MLKYIIFILVFNALCFAQDFDIYEISDRKPAVKLLKRQFNVPPEVNPPPEPPQNSIANSSNSAPAVPAASKPQTASKNEIQPPKEKVEAAKNQSEAKPKNSEVGSHEEKKVEKPKHNNTEPIFKNTKHQGAAMRGFYVFLGLSILIIIYFIFKAFRLRPGAPPPTTVRKYGIVGRRSDMEMLPLPLAEEEDDDTLFDMGTQINR